MHGEPDALFVCAIHRLFVPRIGVSEDAHHGVVGQHPGQSAISRFRAVGHNHLAGVLAEEDLVEIVKSNTKSSNRGIVEKKSSPL